MSEVVGTAWVRIRALTTGLAGEISDAVEKAGVSTRPITEKVGDKIGFTLGDSTRESMIASMKRGRYPDLIPDSVGEKTGIRLGQRISSAWTRFWTNGKGKQDTDAAGKSTGAQFLSSVDKALRKFDKIKIPWKISLPAIGAPAIAGAIKALGAYAITLVGLLGNVVEGLAGVGAAAGGVFAAVGLAAIPVLLAFKTETPALTRFQDAAKNVGKAWQEVGIATQKTLLPGLTDALNMSKQLIPLFKTWGSVVGGIVGDTAKWAVASLTTAKNQEKLGGFLFAAGAALDNIKNAIVNVVDALPSLLNGLGPVTVKFSEALNRLAEKFRTTMVRMSDDGSLADFFDRSYDKGMKVFGALKDIVVGLWNVFKVGSASTQPIMDRFASWAEGWRAWTTSTEGQDKLKRMFDNALPVFHEINLLLKEILGLIFKPITDGNNSGIVSFLQTLRLDILPVLVTLVRTLTDSIDAGNLTGFIEKLGELFNTLAESGALTSYLTTLNILMTVFIKILDTPVIGDAVVALVALLGVMKALSFIKIGGLISSLGLLVIQLGFLGPGAAAAFGGTSAMATAHPIITALSEALGGSGLAGSVGTFLAAAAPVAAVIAAITAVIAGLYFTLDPVRKAIDDIWDTLQGVFDQIRKFDITDVAGNASAGIKLILTAVTFFPRIILTALQGIGELIWGWIRQLISNIPGWFSSLAETVGSAVSGAATAVWDWLTNAASEASGKIGSFLSQIPGWFTDLATSVSDAVLGAASAVWDWLTNAVSEAPAKIGYFIGYVLGLLYKLPLQIASTLVSAGTALWSWIQDAIPQVAVKITEFVGGIWNAVSGFVAELPGRIFGAVTGITQWVIDSIPVFAQNISNWASNVWNAIAGFISELPGRIMGAVGAIIGWVAEAARQMPGKLAEFATTIYNWAIGLPGQIVSWLANIGLAMLDVGWDIVEGIWKGISAAGGWLWNKIKEFAGGIVSGFLDAIGASSPAKELIPVGEYITRGIGVGITSQASVIDDAFNSIMAPYMDGKWVAKLDPFGGSLDLTSSSMVSAALVSSTPQVGIIVKIGERDITDIVDTQVSKKNADLARRLVARNA